MLKLSPGGRLYAAKRDAPDDRDRSFAALEVLTETPYKLAKTQNIVHAGPVRDQGNEGACTAFASCAQLEYLYRRRKKAQPVFSPAFLYWLERQEEGTLGEGDCGAQVRTSVKVPNQHGCCLETTWKYSAGDYRRGPAPEAIAEGLLYRGGAYHRLGTVEDMRSCLASGYGFVLGFNVPESFEGREVERSGVMPVPDAGEGFLGGHEVFAIDYDDAVRCPGAQHSGALLLQNSWGDRWGIDGFFWMAYEVAANREILTDAWIQHLGPAW